MELLAREGLVSRVDAEADLQGWRLSPSTVRIVPGEAVRSDTAQVNRYFHDLYHQIAADLKAGGSSLWGLEGREHTAQVSQRQREWREWRFRYEKEDRANLTQNAAELNAVGSPNSSCQLSSALRPWGLASIFRRSMPSICATCLPPANYAQRAGRAGRSDRPPSS